MTNDFWNIVYKEGFLFKKIALTLYGYCLRFRDLITWYKYDGVYVFLWTTPFGLPIFEWLFCLLNKKIIYDIDDMVFLGHSSSANKFVEKLKGKNKMIYLMKKAKHVIVCTPKLHDFVSQYNSNFEDKLTRKTQNLRKSFKSTKISR